MKRLSNTQVNGRTPLENLDLPSIKKVIIKQLIDQPTIRSIPELAKVVEARAPNEGINGRRIRDNVDQLLRDGYLDAGWKVNFAQIGYSLTYRVDVMIDPDQIQVDREIETRIPLANPQETLASNILWLAEQKPFKEWVLVENVEILLGNPADLCVTARVAFHEHIFDFVTRGLRPLPGIKGTATCQISWSARLKKHVPIAPVYKTPIHSSLSQDRQLGKAT